MRFDIYTLVCMAIAVFATPTTFSADNIAEAFEALTNTTSDIVQILSTLDPSAIIGGIPTVLSDFQQLAEDTGDIFSTKDGKDKIDHGDENKVCHAIENFIDEAKKAVDAVLGDDGLLGKIPFASAFSGVLEALENAVEHLARGILQLIPTCGDTVKGKLDSLDEAVKSRIVQMRMKLSV